MLFVAKPGRSGKPNAKGIPSLSRLPQIVTGWGAVVSEEEAQGDIVVGYRELPVLAKGQRPARERERCDG